MPSSLTNKTTNKAKLGYSSAGAVAAMIAAVLVVEGGYVNNKHDRGGETNMGITKVVAVQNGYTGSMREMPKAVAERIYYKDYIVKAGYEPLINIDAPVVEELFDTGVNMGPARPSRWFQQSVNYLCGTNLTVDGKIGKGTVKAYADCQKAKDPVLLCKDMLRNLDGKQKAFYDSIVRNNPSQKIFYRGWINHRVNNVDRKKCEVAHAR